MTRPCQVCWREFVALRENNIYCSTRCKNTAARRRSQRQTDTTPTDLSHRDPTPTPRPAATRDCPHCGEPITIVALLTTPEAARPNIPGDTAITPLHRRTC